MDNILLLDTSIASLNNGDSVIMECVRKELFPLLTDNFELSVPTHLPPFHWYQVCRKSKRIQIYKNCKYKFVGGTNLLVPDLRTHFPQWNVNLFNYQPLSGSILVGVGAGNGAEGSLNWYTKYIYRHLLSHCFLHSVRDERSLKYLERLGLQGINTGCVTMWMLTPDFCRTIPIRKSPRVVFTLTAHNRKDERDQKIIDVIQREYREVYFWPQGINDYHYLGQFHDIDNINILPATKDAYRSYLESNDTDYVGTRLHGGIYAMRHQRRSIIIAIDERARAIHDKNHLNCVDINRLDDLENLINSELTTNVVMDFDAINRWKQQFGIQ